MASEAPDPSSSVLLTDFDIADVDNWDDQNESSKNEELVKTAPPYVTSPSISSISSPIHSHFHGQLPMKIRPHSNSSSVDNLLCQQALMSSPIQHQPTVSIQPQDKFDDYVRTQNISQQMPGISNQSLYISDKDSHKKPAQSGQALETLRALALEQEEQAKKQNQEQASQMQQQGQLGANRSNNQELNATTQQQSNSSTILTQGIQSTSQTTKQVSIPITTLKLPLSDPRGQGGKQNPVVHVRGQLVRTPDQKLMLVTEFAGKKVGYLINSQSGQLQATNPAIASQLAAKGNHGNSLSESVTKQSIVAGLPLHVRAESSANYEGKTILDSVGENSNDSSQPVLNRQESVTISSDEDSSLLSDVSSNLQNTHLDSPSISDKRRKKGKGKKKKDKNEPVKPISPYLMFFKDVQPSVRQENPGAGLGEVSKMVSKLWEQLGKDDKQVYFDRSNKAKEEYQIKLAKYKASLEATSPAGSSQNQNITAKSDERSLEPDGQGFLRSTGSSDGDTATIRGKLQENENEDPSTIVVSSSDSSPESSSRNTIVTSGKMVAVMAEEDASSMDVDFDNVESTRLVSEVVSSGAPEQPVVRKRGRPKSLKNKTSSMNLPKAKKGKRKEKLGIRENEKPLKLTMTINIKDSKITESPTRAFADLEEGILDDGLPTDKDEDTSEMETDEKLLNSQPKALVGFRIPKKQRVSTDEGDAVKKENGNQPLKPSPSGPRKCVNSACDQAAKINKERGPSYCSSKCLVLHCREIFETWVDERKKDSNKG